MQRYAEGISREQIQVLSFEEMICEDNPVRVFDAFVSSEHINKVDKDLLKNMNIGLMSGKRQTYQYIYSKNIK